MKNDFLIKMCGVGLTFPIQVQYVTGLNDIDNNPVSLKVSNTKYYTSLINLSLQRLMSLNYEAT